jgi:ABC-type lipoprotein release transport system permease subunit
MQGTSTASMAWRNLWRNKRRTAITLFGISFGTLLAVLFTGIGDSSYSKMIDTGARMGSGHVTFQHVDYQEAPSLGRTVRIDDALIEQVERDPDVGRVTRRVAGQAMIATASENLGAFFMAVDPGREDRTTLALLDAISAGEMFAGTDGRGVLLGARLAKNLGVALGKKVVLTVTDKTGEIASELLRVRGIIETGAPSLDGGLVLVPIDRMRRVLGYQSDETMQAAIFLTDQRASAAVADRLRALAPANTAVLTWRETQKELAGFIQMKVGGTLFFEALILLLVAAGIFNTLFVSVMERMREFGIMSAIGFGRGKLFGLVMWESLWLALAGLVSAATLTAPLYYYLATTGVDMSKMVGDGIEISGVGMDPIIKIGLYPESGIAIAAVVLLATLLSGIYPALRAGNVAPVESIKLV